MIPSPEARSTAAFLGFLAIFLGAVLGYTPPLPAAAPLRVLPPPLRGPSEARDSIIAEEARAAGMPVALALAISHTENWGGDSTAVHRRSGATGLMQVMPTIWADSFFVECGDQPLTWRRRNACVGIQVALKYYRELGNWEDALRAYVGDVCLPRDTPARCAGKRRTGDEYLQTIVRYLYRTDLSPMRDRDFAARGGMP